MANHKVSLAVEKIASRIVGRDWALYNTIFQHWREVVGDEYAAVVVPVKFSMLRNGREISEQKRLHLSLPRGLMTDIGFAKPQILQRIAACIGSGVVTDLVLEAHHKPPPSYLSEGGSRKNLATAIKPEWQNHIVSSTLEPELCDALASLGLSLLNDVKSR